MLFNTSSSRILADYYATSFVSMVPRMGHKIAKLILEHADSFLERTEAIDVAMSLGMTLDEIQDYLDWIDSLVGKEANQSSHPTAEQVQEENIAPPEDRMPMKNGEGNPQ